MLRVFINRYHNAAQEHLIQFLDASEKGSFLAQEVTSSELSPMLTQASTLLQSIHYSWIEPLLSSFPNNLQSVILGSLNSHQLIGLPQTDYVQPAPIVKTFIHNQLYSLLKGDEHLAIEYLPITKISQLVKWNKSNLIKLIDFLGLYDAASEIRHIVSREHLQNLYACLTPPQLYYLKQCLHQKEQLVTPKLGIDLAKQDSTLLKRILHRRGLLRLGRACCGEHPDFVWYISRILDTGRGNILIKEYQQEAMPKVTDILQQQVINIIQFFNSAQV